MRRLLAHAVERSPFHARRLRGVDIGGWRLGVRDALRSAGLERATVELRCVDSIERNPATGKVRRFIPLDGAPGTEPR